MESQNIVLELDRETARLIQVRKSVAGTSGRAEENVAKATEELQKRLRVSRLNANTERRSGKKVGDSQRNRWAAPKPGLVVLV